MNFNESQLDFIRRMTPFALEASKATGVDPRIIIGQAAVESNYGKSAPGNNYFGIKGPGQSLATTEYGPNGAYKTQDSFRTYKDMGDSVQGYADFINKNPRYGAFKSANGMDDQLAALQKSGYATAPNYSTTVGGVARSLNLPDLPPAQPPAQNGAVATAPPTNPPPSAGGLLSSNTPAASTDTSSTPKDFNMAGLLSSSLAMMNAANQKPQMQLLPASVHRPQSYDNLFSGLLG